MGVPVLSACVSYFLGSLLALKNTDFLLSNDDVDDYDEHGVIS